MKYNFSRVKITDIDGNVVPEVNLHKTIGNIVWRGAKTLDLVDTAIFINRGEEVELDKLEIAEIRSLINDEKNGVFAYARKAIFDYIDRVQEEHKNRNKKKSKG